MLNSERGDDRRRRRYGSPGRRSEGLSDPGHCTFCPRSPLVFVVPEVSQTQDGPKEAAQAEADAAEPSKSDDGAPDQTSESDTDDKKPHDGTPKEGEDAANPPPPDLSEAPEESSQVCFLSSTRTN